MFVLTVVTVRGQAKTRLLARSLSLSSSDVLLDYKAPRHGMKRPKTNRLPSLKGVR